MLAILFCSENFSETLSLVQIRVVEAVVTGYCPGICCCGKYADGKTSTGKDARLAGVAVAPNAISYGLWVHIPGAGFLEADDTGGAMRRSWKKGIYHIDLRFSKHQDALNWGRKKLKITILRKK
tara:strand:- start:209 stop:580 length:372 start_codon:yes stop_codon:yes gene_type:complete